MYDQDESPVGLDDDSGVGVDDDRAEIIDLDQLRHNLDDQDDIIQSIMYKFNSVRNYLHPEHIHQ